MGDFRGPGDYGRAYLHPETHEKLKEYIRSNRLRGADAAVRQLLEEVNKNES